MNILIEKNVVVAMRDGTELATDVYRPDSDERYPVLLQRTPYSKDAPALFAGWLNVMRTVQSGYVLVVQDTRGRFLSQGEFVPFDTEGADGADAIAWAAAQQWSTGAVGMVGGSYLGGAQWLAAAEAPAALRAIAPAVASDQFYDGWTYQGGALQLGFVLYWALGSLGTAELVRRSEPNLHQDLERLVDAIESPDQLFRRLPTADVEELAQIAPYYREWLSHPSYDSYWAATATREAQRRVTVPALNIGGWYDLFLAGTIANYLGMKVNGANEISRSGQRLVIGPWAHGTATGWFPEQSYGTFAGAESSDLTGVQLAWFDSHLKGLDTLSEHPVRLFIMGANIWRDEPDWPLPDTEYIDYFLHSEGAANTSSGDGTLSNKPPSEEPADRYVYDPQNPVPTVGGATFLPGLFIGANAGPRDQRSVESRDDVLCFTSDALPEPVEVTGPVELVLYVSSSAVDTDFTGKLIDVYPDGRAENLCEGIQRVRYRDSLSHPVLMEPGNVYEIRVDLVATANVFASNHRIRLEVSSSNFPRFDRNSNTGGVIAEEPAQAYRAATNQIHHNAEHPSRLVLPVIRNRN
jgi:putative CocE/NonD family hydrolase